jgi:hypothetical protein
MADDRKVILVTGSSRGIGAEKDTGQGCTMAT